MRPRPKPTSQERTVRGIVAPASWDDDDQLGAIAIWTDEEEEILVDEDSEVDLWSFLRAEIVAEGTVRDHVDGLRSMAVRRIIEKIRSNGDDD